MALQTITSLFFLTTSVTAFYKGLNYGAKLPSGACLSQQDWTRAFQTAKDSAAHFDIARVFASSDCNTLANAVPAAIATGTKILGGIWTQNEEHYAAEKAALIQALDQYPRWPEWLVAVSVGSEDLYRKEVDGESIRRKVVEVREILRSRGVRVPVGHVDTWTAWVDPANRPLIKELDFAGTDEYPYWQGATMMQAPEVFWDSIQEVIDAVNKVKPGLPVWVTETGWPVGGKPFNAATSSIENAQRFWKDVACPGFNRANFFWYAYSEPTSNPNFSTFDENDRPLYDLSC